MKRTKSLESYSRTTPDTGGHLGPHPPEKQGFRGRMETPKRFTEGYKTQKRVGEAMLGCTSKASLKKNRGEKHHPYSERTTGGSLGEWTGSKFRKNRVWPPIAQNANSRLLQI